MFFQIGSVDKLISKSACDHHPFRSSLPSIGYFMDLARAPFRAYWRQRPVDLVRRLVAVGLIPALMFAVSAEVIQLEASKKCRGDFSSDFSRDFNLRRCDVVLKRVGGDLELRLPMAQPGSYS
jgi:hypothetical protein